MTQALGVVHVLISSETAKHRLSQQTYQRMAAVLTCARIGKRLARHRGQAECVVAIFDRIKKAKIAFGSAPWSLDDGKLNDWGGGRGLYFRDPEGHVLEIMTVPTII